MAWCIGADTTLSFCIVLAVLDEGIQETCVKILRLLALSVVRNEACRRTCSCAISFMYIRLVASVLELVEEVVFHGIIYTRAC